LSAKRRYAGQAPLPPLVATMGGRPLWQAEIGRIIARTEENLRAPRTGPPLYKVPRVAEAAFTAPLLHASFMTSAASAEERRTPAPAATVPIEPSPPPSASVIAALTSGLSGEARTVATRLLEHTRADIDLRSNLAGRHAQALREELAHGLHEAERRWVDLAKEIEATVSGAIEAERQLRAGGEEKTTRLEASVAATRKELLGLIGDGQAELVEQGGVLRQVEQELLAFKAETEVALAEEGKRLSALAERQRVAAGELDTAAAGETIGRLQELETALLKERELRKAVEAELGELRCSVAQERDRLPAEIEAAVAREVALSGGGAAAVAALEDKVKECGRLLLRMGGDLMEEGRRRQAIEAEVQELRLRLSSVEVVSHPAVRSPLGMGGAPPPTFSPCRKPRPPDPRPRCRGPRRARRRRSSGCTRCPRRRWRRRSAAAAAWLRRSLRRALPGRLRRGLQRPPLPSTLLSAGSLGRARAGTRRSPPPPRTRSWSRGASRRPSRATPLSPPRAPPRASCCPPPRRRPPQRCA